MLNQFKLSTAVVLSAASVSLATPPAGYQLFWADEFDGPTLNESDWWYRADEKQQSIQLPSNVEIDNGELVLNLTPLATPINGFDAAGAGVISQQRFHYGYYETRSKLGDGIDHDGDGDIDEGWHHAFWAMAAEADENGHVLTTFPSFRRTEIDGYENGSSGDIGRMRQHVLVWNDAGNITQKIPSGSSDITQNPAGTEYDWHTYGFEWTPDRVNFYVDDVLTKVAEYPVEQFEHDQINLWLTAISTNAEANNGVGQELSEARYDYFRFYEPGSITVAAGETLQVGSESDITTPPVGGTITTANFGPAGSISGDGGTAGDVTVESTGLLHGAGTVYGDVTVESGGTLRVAQELQPPTPGVPPTVTSEDFESFTPGVAFENNAATGLMPDWSFFDLGSTDNDVRFEVSGADGTPNEPGDLALIGESQMLFQTNPDIDFANDPGGSAFAGAVAVSNTLDTSGTVDIVEADIVFDGYGDDGGQNLDHKLVFGFRDINNWFSLSLVAGQSNGTGVYVDVIANIDGDRQNVFHESGTGNFSGNFPQDTILHTILEHDASTGLVSFSITDPSTGDVLAEAFVVDDRFMFDGLVGLAVNNDAAGIDNLTVTSLNQLPVTGIQTFEVDGDFILQAGGTLALDIQDTSTYDRLEVAGQLTAQGTLDITQVLGHGDLQLGDSFDLLDFGSAVGSFEQINLPTPASGLAWDVSDLLNTGVVSIVAALAGDLDGDGFVGLSDLDTVLNNWNQSVTSGEWSQGDPSGDGFVGLADLDIVLNNWNAGTPPIAQTNIPEPASYAVLCLFGAALARSRRSG